MQDGLHQRGRIWHFYWKDPQGHRREISTRTRDFQQARGIRARRLMEFQQADFPLQDARLLFSEAAHQWLKHANPAKRENTRRSQAARVTTLIEFFGGMRLREITPARILYFQTQRARAVANSTCNGEFWGLHAILKRFGAWTQAHAQTCRPLPVEQGSKGRALSGEERENLLGCAQKNSRWRGELLHVITLALHTGLRSAEIKGLRLRDIALDAQPRPRLIVERASTKSNAGARPVILDETAVRTLQPLLTIAHGRGARRPEHFLFPRRIGSGGKWDPGRSRGSWTSAWRSLRHAAGLPGLRFHDLRHTYITMGAEAGVPLDVMMRQVGHMTPEQTRYYVHISDTSVIEAIEAIEKRLHQTSVAQEAATSSIA